MNDDVIITISISEETSQASREAVHQIKLRILSSNPRGLMLPRNQWSYTPSSSLDHLRRSKATKQHEEVNWMKEGF